MTVTVTKSDMNPKSVADGQAFYVKDGHLIITKWNGAGDENVAVFAPSTWVWAEVTDSA